MGKGDKGLLVKTKKGLEMAFNTIIIMVLAIALLVFLVFMLSSASSSFREKIGTYFSSSNVDMVKENCNNLASSNSNYEFCCVLKEVKLGKKLKVETTCFGASNYSWGGDIANVDCEGVC